MKDAWMSDDGSRPSSSAESGGEDIEGEFLPGVGFQDGIAHATQRILKRQIRSDPCADERGVHQGADHALGAQPRTVGHRGGDTNVTASASGHQQNLEACQQRHEQRYPSAMAQRAQARDQILRQTNWFVRNVRAQQGAFKVARGGEYG